MSVLIAASAIRTCFGDGDATFAALLAGRSGVGELRYGDAAKLNVAHGYHIAEDGEEALFRASTWLTACVRDVLAEAAVDPGSQRVVAIVGTGLRELRAVERASTEPLEIATEHLHFATAVQRVSPHIAEVTTLANACSAGGHALALAQDLLELGEADAVVAAGTDAMTESMLAIIGRVADRPTERVRPFDIERTGALLGEGAAAMVLVPEGRAERPLARLLGTGLSCDAHHETAPSQEGLQRALGQAFNEADRLPTQVDLVVAHGTGTALNDPLEAGSIRENQGPREADPLVTGIKGAIGHTSGASALMSLDVALRCLRGRAVPPIVGLKQPLQEGRGVDFVIEEPAEREVQLAQVNALGFGGVNAISLVENIDPSLPLETERAVRTVEGQPAAVTGWSLVVPGLDLDETLADCGFEPGLPPDQAHEMLGRKGLLNKDPATRLALCAVHQALGLPAGAPRSKGVPDPRTAVIASSNFGNMAKVCAIVEALRQGSVRDVSPLDAPNASSNVIASAVAIWFRFGGPNLMVCSGAASGLAALELALVLLGTDRADRVVVVGAEPDDPVACTLHRRRASAEHPLRAGAAAVVLQPASAASPDAPLLHSGPIAPPTSHQPPTFFLGPQERAPRGTRRVIDLERLVGDTYGAAGVLQAAVGAALLSAAPANGSPVLSASCGDASDGRKSIHMNRRAQR